MCQAKELVDFLNRIRVKYLILHTHVATLLRAEDVIYGNDGTWQSDDPHFIAIKDTTVYLCKFMNAVPQLVLSECL